MKLTYALLAILALAAVPLAGCGGGGGGGDDPIDPVTIVVTISPASVDFDIGGQSQGFTATVSGTTNKVVTWSISEGASGGTIVSTGNFTATYTAPDVEYSSTFHVVATSVADPSKSATAEVYIGPPPIPD
jgi:hypothetical protein